MVDSSTPARRPRRGLRLVAVVAVVALVVVAARSADRATVRDVLSIPEYGTVRADRLANGTPVFVIARPAEAPGGSPTVDVLQAFTTEVEGPVTGLVGWCADAGMFVDAHHGSLYDVRGRRLPSSTTGRQLDAVRSAPRTALDDLIHRVAVLAEGRDAAGDPIVVEGVQGLQPWQVEQRPRLDPDVPPDQCRLGPGTPVADPDAQPTFRRLVDHSFYARTLDRDARGWQVTDGWLVVGPDGEGTWCDEEPVSDPAPRCPATDVVVDLDLSAADVGGVGAVIGGPLAVRLVEGGVARVAVMADSTWRGSSLRGSERWAGTLIGSWTFDDPSVRVRDLGPAGAATGCTGYLPAIGGVSRVGVDAGTTFDVAGVTDPSAMDQLPLDRGVEVEVVVDAATCRALSIRGT